MQVRKLISGLSKFKMVLALAAVMAIGASSCTKSTKPDEGAVPTATDADVNQAGDSDTGKAMGLQTVNFPYDSFVIDGKAKGILKANADILKDKSSLKVQIEGHCDQRGGIQYNIALGEKRANITKKYLVDLGIAADRVTTISFGKERPIDSSENEGAYAKNRRSNFVITSH